MRKTDRYMFNAWYSKRKMGVIRRLSKHGVVIEGEDQAVLGAQLHDGQNGFAVIENVISDPNVRAETRRLAYFKAFEFLEDMAKGMGYLGVMNITNNEKLAPRFQDMGYHKEGDSFMIYSKEF